jgi:hypothetical protein
VGVERVREKEAIYSVHYLVLFSLWDELSREFQMEEDNIHSLIAL